MIPQEKAEELIGRYFNACIQNDAFGNLTYSQILPFIKQCALIAADEILDEVNSVSALAYWQEVKQEIKKL